MKQKDNKISDNAGIVGIYLLLAIAIVLSVYAITLYKRAYPDKIIVEQNINLKK